MGNKKQAKAVLCGTLWDKTREPGLFILLVVSLFFKKMENILNSFPDYKLIPSVGKKKKRKKFNIDVCEEKVKVGNFLAFQWLGFRAFTARAWVHSLLKQLRCNQATQYGQKKKESKK